MVPQIGRMEDDMDRFAVAAIPVVNVDEWLTFCREAAEGDRADAHRQFLRRGGVTREHILLQRTPAGDLMLLVWEGVDPQQQVDHMASLLADPQSEHERYLRDRVLPELHGFDPTQPAPQAPQRIATIEP
jgi:hypothetical protein